MAGTAVSSAEPQALERLAWSEHLGQRILRADLRNLDREGLLALTEQYGRALRPLPPLSVRLLVLHGSIEFHPDALTRGRGVLIEVSSRVLRSAVVGPDGMMKLAIERFFDTASLLGQDLHQRGRNFPEGDEERALTWLKEP